MTRDEVARRVAERLGRRFDEWIEDWAKHQPESAVMKLWNALLDAELRADKAELRIQELREALRGLVNAIYADFVCICDSTINIVDETREHEAECLVAKAESLLSDR